MIPGKSTQKRLILLFIVFLIIMCLRLYLLTTFDVVSESMMPALGVGDRIVVVKIQQGSLLNILPYEYQIERGDIVIVKTVGQKKLHVIKRVIGVPGDTIRLIEQELYLNNRKVHRTFKGLLKFEIDTPCTTQVYNESLNSDSDYYIQYDLVETNRYAQNCLYCNKEFTVPEGELFLMGDNRDESLDSRHWGTFSQKNVSGIPLFVLSQNQKFVTQDTLLNPIWIK